MATRAPVRKLREYRRKRDFERTAEPAGGVTRAGRHLAFVVQKHEATHLHFDLRLEVGGVMKSWAVPKGPSLDPSVKRLAMEVEDHPVEYNDFEGTIPAGEYGGGTVMLWDRGSYEPAGLASGTDPERALARMYRKGRIDFTLHGERLRGGFVLLRTRDAEGSGKAQWLLKKVNDDLADGSRDIVEEAVTSVESGRSMPEIAGMGAHRVWRSNRAARRAEPAPAPKGALSPMLAEVGRAIPPGDGWTFEPKLDGIRVLAYATADAVSLVTRNGNQKAARFPEVVHALRGLASAAGEGIVLDGEIVGIDATGAFRRFESVQGRTHQTDPREIERAAKEAPTAFVAFDLLLAGEDALAREPWTERRSRLEALLHGRDSRHLRLGESSAEGDRMIRRARQEGWEGIVAKRTDAPYEPGRRSRAWLKLKIEGRQELVIGGWTEPRNSRKHFGALLLGYYDESGELVYAGHTGTGFTRHGLEELFPRLSRIERKTSPFATTPKTNERAHWVTPKLVAEVKFNEWTSDGKLRQPVFLGLRDDKDPRLVVREKPSLGAAPPTRKAGRRKRSGGEPSTRGVSPGHPAAKRVRALADAGGAGKVPLGKGESLEVSNLGKVFFPKEGYTKADLLEYYAGMSKAILPWMEDRPLVLKRYPEGIEGEAFYQQSAPGVVPPGVRVERVRPSPERDEDRRLVGGSLATLLYTVQLGAISYDPWHSRVADLASADYTVIDLDPGKGTSFRTVVRVARRVKEEMDELGLTGAIKTSGSSGIHIYLPLEAGTPLDAATLVAQIVATRVARKHPREATVERSVRKRPAGTVYVDYLQNILGKTVAGVYAVRAKPGATVSTPIRWEELTDDLDFREFTIRAVPDRVREVGELWSPMMARPNAPGRLARERKGR